MGEITTEKDLAVTKNLSWSECFVGVLIQLLVQGSVKGNVFMPILQMQKLRLF